MQDKQTRVLIVEDSKSTALVLSRLLSGFDIVGVACDAREALRLDAELKPDVITMDILLPDTNGLELTRQILARRDVSIVIISSMVKPTEQELIFEALRAGAYEVVAKSRFFSAETDERAVAKLRMLVRAAASRYRAASLPATPKKAGKSEAPTEARTPVDKRRIVVMGASTGGPAVLRSVFSALPQTFRLPILVALHIARGFSEGVSHWLDSGTQLNVRVASPGEMPTGGVIYLAPSGYHLTVDNRGVITLVRCHGEGPCPSVDQLFASTNKTFGSQAVYMLLTGMGTDGAHALLAAKRKGAITAVQDHTTSVAFGMPGEALRLGATDDALTTEEIVPWLMKHASTSIV